MVLGLAHIGSPGPGPVSHDWGQAGHTPRLTKLGPFQRRPPGSVPRGSERGVRPLPPAGPPGPGGAKKTPARRIIGTPPRLPAKAQLSNPPAYKTWNLELGTLRNDYSTKA